MVETIVSVKKKKATQMDLTIKEKAKTSIKATVLDFNLYNNPSYSQILIGSCL